MVRPVPRGGKRVDAPLPLAASRDRAARQLKRLPGGLRKLGQARRPYKVKISRALQSLALAVDAQSR